MALLFLRKEEVDELLMVLLTKGRKGPLVREASAMGAQRLTFPFPFVHHQPHRLESGTTVGKENSC